MTASGSWLIQQTVLEVGLEQTDASFTLSQVGDGDLWVCVRFEVPFKLLELGRANGYTSDIQIVGMRFKPRILGIQ